MIDYFTLSLFSYYLLSPAHRCTATGVIASISLTWGGRWTVVEYDKVALSPISLGTADLLVYHIHAKPEIFLCDDFYWIAYVFEDWFKIYCKIGLR